MNTASALIPTERLKVKTLVPSLSLVIFRRGDDLSVSLGRLNKKSYVNTSVAFATSPINRARVEISDQSATLWIGSAAFDVTTTSGELIQTNFGLRRETFGKEPA
jgi:hypothetical protein